MILTRDEFDQKEREGVLRVAFIGMSNIGKSFRSTQISELKNYGRYEVDAVMGQAMGISDMNTFAGWLSFPYSSGFAERQSYYLEKEKEMTLAVASQQENSLLLDTTGSLIYLDQDVWTYLQKNFLVVMLDAAESMIHQMTTLYFQRPKPLIWGDIYTQKEGESEEEALKRCYPELLKYRRKKYFELSDIVIPGEISANENISPERFWEILRNALPKN